MIDNEDMETNDALEELGDTDGYSIPGLGAGLDVSRAPSKLALESRITSPTSTRIKIAPRIHVIERMKSIHAREQSFDGMITRDVL
jgi:hypothetical protein